MLLLLLQRLLLTEVSGYGGGESQGIGVGYRRPKVELVR
jgi:hypothetical protein